MQPNGDHLAFHRFTGDIPLLDFIIYGGCHVHNFSQCQSVSGDVTSVGKKHTSLETCMQTHNSVMILTKPNICATIKI